MKHFSTWVLKVLKRLPRLLHSRWGILYFELDSIQFRAQSLRHPATSTEGKEKLPLYRKKP